MKPETRLDIAQRLIVEAEAMVARQQELVAVLAKNGSNTATARELLDQFERAKNSFRRTLALFDNHKSNTAG